MANPWKQTRLYECSGCARLFLHDLMHSHWAFRCPARPMPKKRLAPVVIGRIYEPKAGQ